MTYSRTVTAPALAAAGGSYLLLDALRVWLPSLTTIFGSAGTTPDWVFIVFALTWVVPPVLVVPPARRYPRAVPLVAAVPAVAMRLAVQTGIGGMPQLVLSSIGVLAIFCWIIAIATSGWDARSVATGTAVGFAATVLVGLVTTSVDPVWLGGAAWIPPVLAGAALLAGTLRTTGGTASGRGMWFAVGPAILLAGELTTNLGRTWAAHGWPPPWWGAALLALGAGAGIALTAARPGRTRPVPLLLLASVALAVVPRVDHGLPWWAPIPQAAAAAMVAAALARAARRGTSRPGGRGLAAFGGLLLLFVLVALHNSAFDSFSVVWLPIFPLLAALAVALAALRRRGEQHPANMPARSAVLTAGAASVAGIVLAGVTVFPAPATHPAAPGLRLLTYNIRSGISAGGRFDPAELTAVVRTQHPDVVQLQEVDRGMLVTGAQDSLATLERHLGMHAYFAPSSGPMFGEAILTRRPLRQLHFTRMPGHEVAPHTGILSGVLELPSGPVTLVVTHLQTSGGDISDHQVRRLAAILDDLQHPLVLTGDLNAEPGDAVLAPLEDRLHDGLAAARPAPTWPADDPRKQLDHVLLSKGLTGDSVAVPSTTASDHLPVAVTIHRR